MISRGELGVIKLGTGYGNRWVWRDISTWSFRIPKLMLDGAVEDLGGECFGVGNRQVRGILVADEVLSPSPSDGAFGVTHRVFFGLNLNFGGGNRYKLGSRDEVPRDFVYAPWPNASHLPFQSSHHITSHRKDHTVVTIAITARSHWLLRFCCPHL